MHPYKESTRRGAAAVEMAIVAPLLIFLIFSMFEGSRFLTATNACQGAAREAARSAAIFGDSHAVVVEQAEQFMTHSGFVIQSLNVDVSSRPSATVPGYRVIEVTVTIPYSDVSLLGDPFRLSIAEVTGHAATLAEN